MDETKKITRNLSFIKKTITDIDDVIDILIEEGVLGMAERNIILTVDDPVHSILETVLKKQAYDKFIKALRSTENCNIIDRLEATETYNDKETTISIQTDQSDIYTDEEYKQDRADILQKDLEALTKENTNLKLQQAQIRKDLNLKQQRLLELSQETCLYQKQNLELNQRLSNLKRSDVINNIIDSLEGQLKDKGDRNEEIKKEVQARNDEIIYLRNELEQLRKEVDEKTDQIDMLTREMKYLRDENVSARGERKELKLKVENLNSNLEDKMQRMMNVIKETKPSKTPRQSSFSSLTTKWRNRSAESLQSRENTSVFLMHEPKKSNTPRDNEKITPISPRERIKQRVSRPQQFISPQFIFSSKSNKSPRPKAQWK